MKQVATEPDLVSLSVRVSRETADLLKGIADREYRPVAAEIRRIIERHVETNTYVDAEGARQITNRVAA